MAFMASYDISEQFQKLKITSHNRGTRRRKNKYYDLDYFPKATKVKEYVDRSPERYFWLRHPNHLDLKWTIDLIPGTKQFNTVAKPLKDSMGSIKIYNIYKIVNNFLKRQYLLKKDFKEYYDQCVEHTLYHFTNQKALDGIIINNFNWRLSGLSRGSKYGCGISFSPDPKWAEQFCKNGGIKVLLVVKVLVSSQHVGTPGMILPADGYDTTVSPKKNVYVKFEDSEFYPTYLLYYNRHK